MTEESTASDTAYAICGFNDIPSRRAVGFHLMKQDQDGSHRPWPIDRKSVV